MGVSLEFERLTGNQVKLKDETENYLYDTLVIFAPTYESK